LQMFAGTSPCLCDIFHAGKLSQQPKPVMMRMIYSALHEIYDIPVQVLGQPSNDQTGVYSASSEMMR
jgi:hypothetical protein